MPSPERATIRFLGAAGTVTGSKHLVTAGGHRLLLDCGLFQGLKALRLRNWEALPLDPAELDAVVLSHAHLDHVGAVPRLVREGFRGPVFCTAATADLARVVLLDAAHLQEEDAERANRRGYTKHHPALPLYTTAEAEAAIARLTPRPLHEPFAVAPGMTAQLRHAGHILGATTIALDVAGRRVVFSGDLGRWNRPLLPDPELVAEADVLLVESTYGDRRHPAHPEQHLIALVHDVVASRAALVVPAFAIGRTQELLALLRRLEDEGRIPVLPVFVDSPMAIEATEIHRRHAAALAPAVPATALRPRRLELLRSAGESKSLNERRGPMIVISASGMASGGRVLHHLRLRLPDPSTIVLLAGFQAAGTRGRALQDGARVLRIHGEDVPVRARVAVLDGLSAHADRDDLLRWTAGFRRAPSATWVVHGEPEAASAFAAALHAERGWPVRVAEDAATVELA